MSSKSNICQRSHLTQLVSKEAKTYSCIAYPDEPLKYSIVDSKRLSNVDDRGFDIIKELGKSYNIRVEQSCLAILMILDRYKIPVVLENDNENANVKGTDSTDPELVSS
ncbi:unnamed protein product [Rotaria sp. Silwood1]|nr:unnamed protein product [Rotaria sp. Silwood1]